VSEKGDICSTLERPEDVLRVCEAIVQHSFDIFDTVLTRTVGQPEDVFLVCGQRAVAGKLVTIQPHLFARLRHKAEVLARDAQGGEIMLPQIYWQFAFLLACGRELTTRLIELELEVEREVIRAVPVGQDLVNHARTESPNIIFLSDMYLSSEFLLERLRCFNLWKDGDIIYVSGEVGKNKRSGDLFAHVLTKHHLKPTDLLHTGNDQATDVDPCKRAHISARHEPAANLTRFERILHEGTRDISGAACYWPGAARLARLSANAQTRKEATIYKIAAGVAAPALTAYVTWILQRAREKGLHRLYFLARDGQILLKVARNLAPSLGVELDLRYLYASRQAWRLPELAGPAQPDLSWALVDADFLSCESLLARLGTAPQEVKQQLDRIGFPPAAWKRNLSPRERHALSDLVQSGNLNPVIVPAAAQRRERLMAYLQQEGLFDNEQCGLVDLGWHASMQSSLEKILQSKGVRLPSGFYFGLYPSVKMDASADAECFFFDGRGRRGIVSFEYWIEPMMEPFCAADHGPTLDYVASGRTIEPVLKHPRNEACLAWGLERYQEVVIAFAKQAVSLNAIPENPRALLPVLDRLFIEFWLKPERDEVEAWGDYPHPDDQTDHSCRPLAEPLGVVNALRSARRAYIVPTFEGGWQAGSLVRSPWWIRKGLPLAMKISRRLRRARHG
jgi:FMN phosphatase YigB (HAD superfamily)